MLKASLLVVAFTDDLKPGLHKQDGGPTASEGHGMAWQEEEKKGAVAVVVIIPPNPALHVHFDGTSIPKLAFGQATAVQELVYEPDSNFNTLLAWLLDE